MFSLPLRASLCQGISNLQPPCFCQMLPACLFLGEILPIPMMHPCLTKQCNHLMMVHFVTSWYGPKACRQQNKLLPKSCSYGEVQSLSVPCCRAFSMSALRTQVNLNEALESSAPQLLPSFDKSILHMATIFSAACFIPPPDRNPKIPHKICGQALSCG